MSKTEQRRTHVAYCGDCEIHTENRHTKQSAVELCEMHNESREGCEAEPIPVCWVCHDRATHKNQMLDDVYVCEEHAVDIDAVPLSDD